MLPPLAFPSSLPLLAAPSLVASVGLPELYSQYKASGDGLGFFVLLLLAKRCSLYAAAASTVYVAARRSGDAPPGLGARLEKLTKESTYPFKYPGIEQEEFKVVVKEMDSTSDAAQAATLPLVFGALLVGAYALNLLSDLPPPQPTESNMEMAIAMQSAFAAFQPLSTASVCLFALNAELQAFVAAVLPREKVEGMPDPLPSDGSTDEAPTLPPAALAAFASAFIAVGAAYLLPTKDVWPLQNVLNSCVAIGVARVLQLPSLPAVCAALVGLTLYDGIGTLGAASAASVVSAASSASAMIATSDASAVVSATDAVSPLMASASVMEGVAQARLGYGSGSTPLWQPGLLTVLLEGRTTDALGLGDVVGPSILAGWCHRFDLAKSNQRSESDSDEGQIAPGQGGYLATALGGYAAGCVLLEIGPPELTRAALLFLTPPMLIAVLARLTLRGELAAALQPVEAPAGLVVDEDRRDPSETE